jgi:hypothetical protein
VRPEQMVGELPQAAPARNRAAKPRPRAK